MHFDLTVRCGFTSALFLSEFTIDFVPCILCWAMLAIPNHDWIVILNTFIHLGVTLPLECGFTSALFPMSNATRMMGIIKMCNS